MILNEKYQGPLKFTQDTTMQGMVIGDVTVIAGVELTLQGMVSGNLTIEAGAIASVQGVVKGLIINEGGHCLLYTSPSPRD